jgi:hypothetical protein
MWAECEVPLNGVVNLIALIASGGTKGTRADPLWTHAALRQPSLCL